CPDCRAELARQGFGDGTCSRGVTLGEKSALPVPCARANRAVSSAVGLSTVADLTDCRVTHFDIDAHHPPRSACRALPGRAPRASDRQITAHVMCTLPWWRQVSCSVSHQHCAACTGCPYCALALLNSTQQFSKSEQDRRSRLLKERQVFSRHERTTLYEHNFRSIRRRLYPGE